MDYLQVTFEGIFDEFIFVKWARQGWSNSQSADMFETFSKVQELFVQVPKLFMIITVLLSQLVWFRDLGNIFPENEANLPFT